MYQSFSVVLWLIWEEHKRIGFQGASPFLAWFALGEVLGDAVAPELFDGISCGYFNHHWTSCHST